MSRSLSATTSIAWSHHGWAATSARNREGTASSSRTRTYESSQRTRPVQSRYWPRKNDRSSHQRGRKNRWRRAGKISSSGRNTRTKKTKLAPTESAMTGRLTGRPHFGGAGGGKIGADFEPPSVAGAVVPPP